MVPDTDCAKVAIRAAHARDGSSNCIKLFFAGHLVDATTYSPARKDGVQQPLVGATPVLASLPLVSPSRIASKRSIKAKQPVGYRFDPPQAERRKTQTANERRSEQARPLKSELVYAPRATPPRQPHVFDWALTREQRERSLRAETRHLPRSNTFAAQRRITWNSLTQVVRFLAIVVLFAVIGTWYQLTTNKRKQDTDSKSTTTPINQAIDPAPKAPTAIGPISAPAEKNTRIGRVRAPGDFATLRGDILPVPSSVGEESAANVADALPKSLPRLQVVDTANTADSGTTATPPAPKVANVPGFMEDLQRSR